jgi:hypothetical protein
LGDRWLSTSGSDRDLFCKTFNGWEPQDFGSLHGAVGRIGAADPVAIVIGHPLWSPRPETYCRELAEAIAAAEDMGLHPKVVNQFDLVRRPAWVETHAWKHS